MGRKKNKQPEVKVDEAVEIIDVGSPELKEPVKEVTVEHEQNIDEALMDQVEACKEPTPEEQLAEAITSDEPEEIKIQLKQEDLDRQIKIQNEARKQQLLHERAKVANMAFQVFNSFIMANKAMSIKSERKAIIKLSFEIAEDFDEVLNEYMEKPVE